MPRETMLCARLFCVATLWALAAAAALSSFDGISEPPSSLAYPSAQELVAVTASRAPCLASCPSGSRCGSLRGSPMCLCSTGQHLVRGQCTPGTLEHSDFLDSMNNARAAVGSPSLVWDDKLAKRALAWAKVLGSIPLCKLRHGGWLPGEGQTLAGGAGKSQGSNPNTFATNLWVAEGSKYRNQIFDLRSGGCTTGDWRDCGHYTQIIWRSTRRVGCASVLCLTRKRGRLWVCNFSPGGNQKGKYPFTLRQM